LRAMSTLAISCKGTDSSSPSVVGVKSESCINLPKSHLWNACEQVGK
jgi:hypothetical protein